MRQIKKITYGITGFLLSIVLAIGCGTQTGGMVDPGTGVTVPNPNGVPPSNPTPANPTPPVSNPPAAVLPTANAGADQTVEDGITVNLVGQATGPIGAPLTYQWTQTTGTPVTLANSNTLSASFTAPETSGTLEFQISVSAAEGTVTDVVKVTVRAAPILFVANSNDGSVLSFRCPSTTAIPMSVRTVLKGPNSRLTTPVDLVLDKVNGVIVTNGGNDRIAGFYDALTATGNVTPQRYVTNPDANVNDPEALACDRANDLLFVGNFSDFPGSVTVYANASQLGLATPAIPVRRFTSFALMNPRGMRLVPSGELYVACAGSQSVSVFAGAASLNGPVNASREVRSPALENAVVADVHVDAGNHLYVVDSNGRQVVMFKNASQLNGSYDADAVIVPSGAQEMRGMTIDKNGTAYIADTAAGAIYVVPDIAAMNGTITPALTVTDGTIPLKGPCHLALVER